MADAAARLGISPDMLRAELTVGRCPVRSARMGKRGLVLLASNDVDVLARQMAAGALA